MSESAGMLSRVMAICPAFADMARIAFRQKQAQISRDRIAQARAVGVDTGMAHGRDYGPGIRHARKELVREYREDPDPSVGALVRGARMRDPVLAMLTAGSIDAKQFQACERLRDDVAIGNGVRNQIDNAGIRSAYSGGNWPPDAQLDRIAIVHILFGQFTPDERAIVVWVIGHNGSLDGFARTRRTRRKGVSDLFAAALDVMVDFYDARPN